MSLRRCVCVVCCIVVSACRREPPRRHCEEVVTESVKLFDPATGRCEVVATACDVDDRLARGFHRAQADECLFDAATPVAAPPGDARRGCEGATMLVPMRMIDPSTKRCVLVGVVCELWDLREKGYRNAGPDDCPDAHP